MFVHNEVICGRHNDIGIRVERHDLVCKIGSTGCSILARWLADDVVIAYFGDLLAQGGHILFIGNEVYVFLGANMLEAVVGPLYQRLAGSQQVQKLFWKMCAAFGPKPAAYTTGHNGHIIVLNVHWTS